jgi:hypothetical protein
MYSTTFKFTIEASNYQEIIEKIKLEISSFLNVEVDDLGKYVNYEIDIEQGNNKKYNAQATVRIKNV